MRAIASMSQSKKRTKRPSFKVRPEDHFHKECLVDLGDKPYMVKVKWSERGYFSLKVLDYLLDTKNTSGFASTNGYCIEIYQNGSAAGGRKNACYKVLRLIEGLAYTIDQREQLSSSLRDNGVSYNKKLNLPDYHGSAAIFIYTKGQDKTFAISDCYTAWYVECSKVNLDQFIQAITILKDTLTECFQHMYRSIKGYSPNSWTSVKSTAISHGIPEELIQSVINYTLPNEQPNQ